MFRTFANRLTAVKVILIPSSPAQAVGLLHSQIALLTRKRNDPHHVQVQNPPGRRHACRPSLRRLRHRQLDLLEAADILPGELVAIVDVTNGARLETYPTAGERSSGVIGINGAAAHLVQKNDIVILIAYEDMTTEEAKAYNPAVVHVDQLNRIIRLGNDPAEGITPGLLHAPPAR